MLNIIGTAIGITNQGIILEYVGIPAPPAFGTTTTITTAVGSSLESGETGGNRDILIPNPFQERLRPNGLVGTSGSPYRYKSVSDSTRSWIGGDILTTGQQVITSLNNSNFNYFYHLGLVGDSNPAVTGISGLAWLATAGGVTVKAEDLIIRDMEFAGVLINQSTTGNSYTLIDLRFLRIFGHSAEGEGCYLGSTNKTANFSPITQAIVQNFYATNKGRDGFQVTHCANLQAKNITCYDVGKADISGQNRLVQIHNTNGYIEYSIFHKAPELADIFTHGFEFRDCYFEWDDKDNANNNAGYIGELENASAFGASASAGNNQPLVFRRCIFKSNVAVLNLFRILEDDCHVQFIDCIFSDNITNIWSDERTDKVTYQITNTNPTYLSASSIPSPTYKNHLYTDEENHGLITSTYHHSRGMGYRTPVPV